MKKFILKLYRKFKNRKNEQIINILRNIGDFFLEESGGDYNKANQEITKCNITQVKYNHNILTIRTTRPGLIIGWKGERIDKLISFLKQRLNKNIKLKLVEEQLLNYIEPINPASYEIYDNILDDIEKMN